MCHKILKNSKNSSTPGKCNNNFYLLRLLQQYIWMVNQQTIAFVSLYNAFVLSHRKHLLAVVNAAAFIAAPLQRYSHTNGSVFTHCISACHLCFEQHKTVSVVVLFLPHYSELESDFYQMVQSWNQVEKALLLDRLRCVYKPVKRPRRFLRGEISLLRERTDYTMAHSPRHCSLLDTIVPHSS